MVLLFWPLNYFSFEYQLSTGSVSFCSALRSLFKCCSSAGWFFLSRRLRRDCHTPSAGHLQGVHWHPCRCICQSSITRLKLRPLLLRRDDADIVSISSCAHLKPHTAGSGAWCDMQIRQGSQWRLTTVCHCQISAAPSAAESASYSSHFSMI